MSAPYTIVNSRHDALWKLADSERIGDAILLVETLRRVPGWGDVTIHGDNIDLDCADGLSDDERDEVQEELE